MFYVGLYMVESGWIRLVFRVECLEQLEAGSPYTIWQFTMHDLCTIGGCAVTQRSRNNGRITLHFWNCTKHSTLNTQLQTLNYYADNLAISLAKM